MKEGIGFLGYKVNSNLYRTSNQCDNYVTSQAIHWRKDRLNIKLIKQNYKTNIDHFESYCITFSTNIAMKRDIKCSSLSVENEHLKINI